MRTLLTAALLAQCVVYGGCSGRTSTMPLGDAQAPAESVYDLATPGSGSDTTVLDALREWNLLRRKFNLADGTEDRLGQSEESRAALRSFIQDLQARFSELPAPQGELAHSPDYYQGLGVLSKSIALCGWEQRVDVSGVMWMARNVMQKGRYYEILMVSQVPEMLGGNRALHWDQGMFQGMDQALIARGMERSARATDADPDTSQQADRAFSAIIRRHLSDMSDVEQCMNCILERIAEAREDVVDAGLDEDFGRHALINEEHMRGVAEALSPFVEIGQCETCGD